MATKTGRRPDQDEEFFNTIDQAIPKDEQDAMEQRAKAGAEADAEADRILKEEGGAEGVENFLKDQAGVSDEKPSLDSYYRNLNEEDKQLKGPAGRIRGSLRKRRNKVAIATIGLVGGGLLSVGFLPLQLTHLAELLTQFNFTINDDTADARSSRLVRYLKYPNNPEMRRLSFFGNKVADRITNRLVRAGITPVYNNAGILVAYDLDATKPSLTQSAEDRGYTLNDEVDGKRRLDLDGKSNRFRRGATRFATAQVYGEGGISRVTARSLNARGGVPFRVAGNLQRKARETLADYRDRVREKRTVSRKNGVPRVAAATQVDPNAPDADVQQQVANEVDEDARRTSSIRDADVDGKTKVSLARKSLIGTVTGLGAITVVCELNKLGEQAAEIRHASIYLPIMRTGMSLLTTSSQILLGDVTADEVGLWVGEVQEVATEVTRINEEGEVLEERELGNAFNSKYIQGPLGNEGGEPLPDSYDPRPETALNFLQKLPNVPPGVCVGAAWAGVGALLVFASLGALKAVDLAISAALLAGSVLWLDDLARWLAGEAVESSPVGANLGGVGYVGTFLAANEQISTMGGKPLTEAEEARVLGYRDKLIAEQNADRSLYDRIFSPDNPRSLAMTAAISMPRGVRSTIASIFTAPFENIGKLFKPVSAQSNLTRADHFDYARFGFTQEELNDPRLENPDDFIRELTSRVNVSEFNEKYAKKCFRLTINDSVGDGSIRIEESVPPEQIIEECKLFGFNPNPEVDEYTTLLYRLYILDTMTATAMGCYEGFETFCRELGFGASQNTGSSTTASADPGLVYVLGDSISDAARGGYAGQFNSGGWNVFVDAYVGRQLTTASIDETINDPARVQELTNATAVVVALGANNLTNVGFADSIEYAITKLREINPSAQYYWVDIGSNVTEVEGLSTDENTPAVYSDNNKNIYDQSNILNYAVVPWFKEVFGTSQDPTEITADLVPANPQYLTADNLHPTEAGIAALASIVGNSVRGLL